MSLESAKAFVERMKTDADFVKEVTACKDTEARMKFVKEAGFDFTAQELKTSKSELTEEELKSLSGGSQWCIGKFQLFKVF